MEDQANVRHLAASVLRECGYRLLEAETGETALQVTEAHTEVTRLLLTDVVHHGVVSPGSRYLQKPNAPHALAEKVRVVLDEV